MSAVERSLDYMRTKAPQSWLALAFLFITGLTAFAGPDVPAPALQYSKAASLQILVPDNPNTISPAKGQWLRDQGKVHAIDTLFKQAKVGDARHVPFEGPFLFIFFDGAGKPVESYLYYPGTGRYGLIQKQIVYKKDSAVIWSDKNHPDYKKKQLLSKEAFDEINPTLDILRAERDRDIKRH